MMSVLDRYLIVFLCLVISFNVWQSRSYGANYPEKPIRVIVAFAAGSGIDMEARGLQPFLQRHLKGQIIIENISGADGRIGLTKLWKSKADGYNLIMHTTTMSMIGETLFSREYRVADFSNIFSWSLTNYALTVNIEEWKTLGDFMKAAKGRTLSVGMAGRGSTAHLNGLILVDAMKIKVNWVPFNGATDALTALAGKHIDFAITGTTTALPLVNGGKLRPLAVLADSKDAVFPDIPLVKNLGYDFPVIPAMRGLDGPPKIPISIVKTIEKACMSAIKEPDYMAWAQRKMIDVLPLSHEEYHKAIEKQKIAIEKYMDFFKAAN